MEKIIDEIEESDEISDRILETIRIIEKHTKITNTEVSVVNTSFEEQESSQTTNETLSNLRGLASLGISSEQYGSMLIPIIMSKLPSEIRLKIARKATTEIWKIDDLLNTIRMEIKAREVSASVQSNPQQN